jgi:signal transduction histidine kinase
MDGPPSIADKLARLAALEADFQRILDAEKLEAMAEFAAGAGHEINNPLTVISGRAQLLLREESDPERQRALALISAQAMRVYEMIADMMLFARPPRPELQPVELIGLIDGFVAEFLTRCTSQETAIRRIGDSEPILVQADPVQLNVVLWAVCQNALEALQSGGEITIQAKNIKGSGVFISPGMDSQGAPERDSKQRLPTPLSVSEIRICDDGPGIKPEERRHLFDPFYSARQAGRGLGLGLSKAWRIVTNHGGRIEVESQPGHGSTFVVTLPVQPGQTALDSDAALWETPAPFDVSIQQDHHDRSPGSLQSGISARDSMPGDGVPDSRSQRVRRLEGPRGAVQ